ncbi:pyridoxine 5'-phosphate synthase [Thioalkalivibrio sp. HK1]|uniref:pyridoxine 5'-phosphate synthase n=1 Tax=Thioalkalivibrio sp. HK1 TaxID=1469245 RepID=UPI0004701C66|nr:pyridoxine 5'-phosphate synthase [Thioalkalivibrio sp. HK1]
MTMLSVNINKIAWLRNARNGERPNLAQAVRVIVEAGAQGITVHPRPDRRHIRPEDVYEIASLLASEYPGIEFNIEGNPAAGARADGYPGFDALIEAVRPQQATLVPDSEDQITSDHGFDLSSPAEIRSIGDTIARYRALGVRTSLFMDAEPAGLAQTRITRAKECGADRIELHTGPFAELARKHGLKHPATRSALRSLHDAARHAASSGLAVNAGHDLDLFNLGAFLGGGEQGTEEIDRSPIAEVSIGHALIADALDFGLEKTVGKYLACIASASKAS